MVKMSKKAVTIDQLAGMVQRGFSDAEEHLAKFRMEVMLRFEHIEKIILEGHRERINQLEDRVARLESDFRTLVSSKRDR